MIMLSVVILRVAFSSVTLNVILLNAIILIVVAPFEEAEVKEKTEVVFEKLLTLILRLLLCEGCFLPNKVTSKRPLHFISKAPYPKILILRSS